MGEVVSEKFNRNGSFHETDSFDEPKGAPISMEPVFSTASGVRIDVKQESMDKSKKLLNNDIKALPTKNSFSSPLIRPKINGTNAFVSPFRREEQNTTSDVRKRPPSNSTEGFKGPPPKKSMVENDFLEEPSKKKKSKKHKKSKKSKKHKNDRKEIIEIHADVMRSSQVYERAQVTLVLQETSSSPMILATCPYQCGKDIKFGDRIHVDAEVKKKENSETVTKVYFDKVLNNEYNGARRHISRHSIADKPYCLQPIFIHELSDEKIKKAIVRVNILDLNFEVYDECTACKNLISTLSSSSKRKDCKNCKDKRTKTKAAIFSRMRVMDPTGQVFVNIATKPMEKVLEIFGYEGLDEWIQFGDPQERKNYVFRPLMIEVEKKGDDWECSDVSEVNWEDYRDYLGEKEKKIIRKIEKKHT